MSGGYGSNGNRGVNLDGFGYSDSNVYREEELSNPLDTPEEEEDEEEDNSL